MLRLPITYDDPLTDQKVTETHLFHISKANLVEMELEEMGNEYTAKDGEQYTGMRAKLKRIMDSENDGRAVMNEIKDMIRRAYGIEKDGRFLKSKELTEEFEQTEAFSQLFFELCTNAELSSDFMNSVVPQNLDEIAGDIREQAERIQAGRDAQATAKATSGVSEEVKSETALTGATGEAEPAGFNTNSVVSRQDEINNASAEYPVTLTQAEIAALSSEQFKAGIADGRFKVS